MMSLFNNIYLVAAITNMVNEVSKSANPVRTVFEHVTLLLGTLILDKRLGEEPVKAEKAEKVATA